MTDESGIDLLNSFIIYVLKTHFDGRLIVNGDEIDKILIKVREKKIGLSHKELKDSFQEFIEKGLPENYFGVSVWEEKNTEENV